MMSQAWVASWLRMPFELPSKIQRATNASCRRCNGLSLNTRGHQKAHKPLRSLHSLAQLFHEPDPRSGRHASVPSDAACAGSFRCLH